MIYVSCAVEGTGWKHETIVALDTLIPVQDLKLHTLQKGDETAYPKMIAFYWNFKQSFAVVEPDIVIREDVVEAFNSCPEGYCAFPYAWLTDVGPALGCTRFRTRFIERYPDAMNTVLRQGVSWRQTDVVLMRHILAKEHGEQPHVHLPAVEHLNEKKKLMEGRPASPLMEVPLW